MANQYYSALYDAAQELRAELTKYRIEVKSDERMILWRDQAVAVPPGTPKRDCLKILHKMIVEQKKLVAEKQLKNQGTLL